MYIPTPLPVRNDTSPPPNFLRVPMQNRIESWIKDQSAKILKVSWGPLQWKMRWWPPPWFNSPNSNADRKRIQIELERRRKQLHHLCLAVKADSISDLQDILCCMILSECVYKRPAMEMVRAVNKFKADFGGQIVQLERVQPSSDHVPHRYLLAEAGDTLFASFIGTKQYKDVMADANILQGAIFHDDAVEDVAQIEATESGQGESEKEPIQSSVGIKSKQLKAQPMPAAHRGFMARAKGIPALELYRLAQKKNRKLVLCGHSLGGAVAALATLAILRVIAASSPPKENERVQVKCITFSQPPVGNAALRDYVHKKGWQHHFKSYCIPEDLVPRILSPAYFHHYNAQPFTERPGVETFSQSMSKTGEGIEKSRSQKPKKNEGEQLVLGLGPVQTSFWRLSRLVPVEGVRRQLNKYTGKQIDPVETSKAANSIIPTSIEDAAEPQSLEIQEGCDGISLKPLPTTDKGTSDDIMNGNSEKSRAKNGENRNWKTVPYLPSYVPFGQLFILGNSSVELLSGAEYSKLTSVKSVIAELRALLQSHSMRSYRSRFQRIYEMCMSDGALTFSGMEQLPQFPHLQQWLGVSVAGTVELAHIVESPVIRTATSIVPLGWSGIPGEKNGEPLKVDITGFGLHLCTLVHAQVNGNWCSTALESFPSEPSYSSNYEVQPKLQKMRVLVGAPLKRPPKHPMVTDTLTPVFASIDPDVVKREHKLGREEEFLCPEGLNDFSIFCTSDFATVSKEVHVRTRRVRLLGLEGAGKTSLFKAIMGQGKLATITNFENLHLEAEVQEGIASGVCYSDSLGVNLQDLQAEASRFRDELWMGIRDLSRKTDLVVLVHNLSHRIPKFNNPHTSQQQPVLSLLLDEAKALGIPWVLAITNKFSVSAHQQKEAIDAVLQSYQASLSTTEVVNSCPYIIPTAAATASLSWAAAAGEPDVKMGAQKLIFAPINLVRRPFLRKDTIFPVEGIDSLQQLVHRELRTQEEAALQEFENDRLLMELARERSLAIRASQVAQSKSSLTSAAVGASLGAGLGIVLAVVMGAASALRKP